MRILLAVAASALQVHVTAAENVWGSIAAQLGGTHASVSSVVANPATDPHDYEPNAFDARAFAGAQLAIVNGAGYDAWASQLLSADPSASRIVLDVGRLAGVRAGGNPHLWYSPRDVRRVVAAIAADYAKLDPRDAAYFRVRKARFETRGLARYAQLIETIRRRFGGTPVGASESIFVPLAQALGLKLLTPSTFLDAVSEGTEPTAADTTAIDRQIARHEIKVWVFNSQNSTPNVARLTSEARARHIPVVSITETLSPAKATFQQWQSTQLTALLRALAR